MKVGDFVINEDNITYKKMYLSLFNAVTDAISALEHFEAVDCLRILKKAQQDCEDIFASEHPIA